MVISIGVLVFASTIAKVQGNVTATSASLASENNSTFALSSGTEPSTTDHFMSTNGTSVTVEEISTQTTASDSPNVSQHYTKAVI